MKTKTFVVLITFNPDLSLFKEIFVSHIRSDCDGIIIVDNNSNNSREIQELFNICKKELIFRGLDSNYGIAKAQNVGVNLARMHDCTHVILFDQDSKSPEYIATELLKEENELISQGISVGAIGPVYYDARTKNVYPLALLNGFRLKNIYPKEDHTDPINLSFIIASGSLIRISVLDDVGEFYDPFFIDLVDIEWCLRALSLGYKVYASPNVSIEHSIGDKRIFSFGKEISIHSPLRRYFMVRNNILMARFNHVPIRYRIRIFFGIVFRSIRFLVAVKFDVDYIHAIFLGVSDGLKNRGGNAPSSVIK